MAARILPTLIVLGLLVGSAAAFAVTEGLKLETSPISRTRIGRPDGPAVFSPVCDCDTDRVRLAFRLAKPDRVTLAIVDSEGNPVRTLLLDRRLEGFHRFTWNGRDDLGKVVPQGPYRLRIQLSDLDRTFLPPKAIQVDTTAPKPTVTSVRPLVFSPDGDHRSDHIVVGYRTSEPARAFLTTNGTPRVRSRIRPAGGQLYWYGKANGRSLRTGSYRLGLVARDRAGNTSKPVPAGRVRIRYIQIQGDVFQGETGRRTHVFVSTDAASYTWRAGRFSGVAHARLLLVPPLTAGRHRLVVEENGHLDAATIVNRKHKKRG